MKVISLIIFLLIIDFYFYLGTLSLISRTIENIFIYKLVYWAVSFSIYIGVIYFLILENKNTGVVRSEYIVIYISFIFIVSLCKFLGSMPLVLDDILRFFRGIFRLFSSSDNVYDIARLDFLKKSALILSGALFSSLLIGMKWGRYNFKKNHQDIFINKWPKELDGYKIVHISDLHLGSFSSVKKIEEIVSMINNENADLIVFTGDLVNNYSHEVIPYVDALSKMKAKDGKKSILGNHDYGDYVTYNRKSTKWNINFENLKELQEKIGFDLLLNESRLISRNKCLFNLVGVENWGAGNFSKDGDLDKAMKNVDDSLPTLLLSHDPSHWDEVVKDSSYQIDLQLSGHTHGMQFGIELPGFKWSPVKYRYKQWAGLYSHLEKQIYVNRGLGHLGYAGRVGIMPDISILKLYKKG